MVAMGGGLRRPPSPPPPTLLFFNVNRDQRTVNPHQYVPHSSLLCRWQMREAAVPPIPPLLFNMNPHRLEQGSVWSVLRIHDDASAWSVPLDLNESWKLRCGHGLAESG